MRGPRNFCQFYLVLSLFYSLQRGSKGFLLTKLYLYFTKDPEGVHYFPGGGGVKPFPGGGEGPNANFLWKPLYVLVIFQEGVSGPPFPLWIRTWAMSSMDNIYHSPASNHNCQALICQD